LIAQFLTLFGGILIGYQRLDSSSTEGSDETDALNTNRIGVVVVGINCMTMVWPLVRLVLVGKHVEYYEKVIWLSGCAHRSYMSYCGGAARDAAAREKAKEERQAERRAAGIRRQTSMPRMDTTNSEGTRDSDLMAVLHRAQAAAERETWSASGQSPGFQADQELGVGTDRCQELDIETGNAATVAPQHVSVAPVIAVLGYLPPGPPVQSDNADSQNVLDRDQVLHEVWDRCEDYTRNQFFRRLREVEGYTELVGPASGSPQTERKS